MLLVQRLERVNRALPFVDGAPLWAAAKQRSTFDIRFIQFSRALGSPRVTARLSDGTFQFVKVRRKRKPRR